MDEVGEQPSKPPRILGSAAQADWFAKKGQWNSKDLAQSGKLHGISQQKLQSHTVESSDEVTQILSHPQLWVTVGFIHQPTTR